MFTVSTSRVASFELLGVTVANNLNWEEHISVVGAKAAVNILSVCNS